MKRKITGNFINLHTSLWEYMMKCLWVLNCLDCAIETQATITTSTLLHILSTYVCNAYIGLDIGYRLLSILDIGICQKPISVHLYYIFFIPVFVNDGSLAQLNTKLAFKTNWQIKCWYYSNSSAIGHAEFLSFTVIELVCVTCFIFHKVATACVFSVLVEALLQMLYKNIAQKEWERALGLHPRAVFYFKTTL